MNRFITTVNATGSYAAMQINGKIDGLTQQWIDRHNPTRLEYRAATVDGRELDQLIEFDDVMDYRDEVRANLRTIVEYRVESDNQAAIAEGHAVATVLSRYRYNHHVGRRNWLIARGYTNVPELDLEPEPAGELDYEWD